MAETPPDVPAAPTADPGVPAPDNGAPAADPVMDILTEGTQDPSKPQSSSGEPKKPEVADGAADPAKGDDKPAPPEVPPKPADGEPPKGDDDAVVPPAGTPDKPADDGQPQGKGEQRKQQLNGEIRDLVAQRNALRTDIEKINAEHYQPATVEELVANGMDPLEARVTASEQRQEVADYNNKVAEAQLTIESESQRILNEFSIFNPDSKDFNKAIADEAADLFNDSIIRDENTGQVIGSTISPYKLYKALAASHNVSAQNGQLAGQKARDEMLARADTTPDTAPKTEKKDPILAILEDVDGN